VLLRDLDRLERYNSVCVDAIDTRNHRLCASRAYDYKDLALKRKLEMECFSPMNYHQNPSIARYTFLDNFLPLLYAHRGTSATTLVNGSCFSANIAIHKQGFYNTLAKAYKNRPVTSTRRHKQHDDQYSHDGS